MIGVTPFHLFSLIWIVPGQEIIPINQAMALVRRSDVLSMWPTVSKALDLELISTDLLLKKRVMIPVTKPVVINRDAVRTENLVRSAIEHSLQEELRGQLDDPVLQKQIYTIISENVWNNIENAIKDREQSMNWWEHLFKIDAANKLTFHQQIGVEVQGSRALAHIEGGAWVKRSKWWTSEDTITFQIDAMIKVIAFDRKTLQKYEANPSILAAVKDKDIGDDILIKREL